MNRFSTIFLCLALTACGGLSVRADLAWQAMHDGRRYLCNGAPCEGPQGEIAIGYDFAVSNTLTLRAEAMHRSYPAARDRGDEYLSASAIWRPWVRQ